MLGRNRRACDVRLPQTGEGVNPLFLRISQLSHLSQTVNIFWRTYSWRNKL